MENMKKSIRMAVSTSSGGRNCVGIGKAGREGRVGRRHAAALPAAPHAPCEWRSCLLELQHEGRTTPEAGAEAPRSAPPRPAAANPLPHRIEEEVGG